MWKLRTGIQDRVGLAWRDELALGIHTHLAEIDCLEVLADREFRASPRRIQALRELARQVPVSLHSVALGLASSVPVEIGRLRRLSRLVEQVRPAHWSEHVAFVRAGGYEIGHLAAPPFRPEVLDGTLANLARAQQVLGRLPHLENVATLVRPAGSVWSEEVFLGRVIRQSGAPMLLDLHNWYANARNFARDPFATLDALPLDRVQSIHLSGGCSIKDGSGREWLVDDHIHDPPDEVFDMLAHVAARCPQPLTVILERDGHYPTFSVVLGQLARARHALILGRSRQAERVA